VIALVGVLEKPQFAPITPQY